MVVDRIVQHKHCINCGRAVPPDKQYCSDKCDNEFVSMQQRRKMLLYINYGMVIIFVIVLILVMSK